MNKFGHNLEGKRWRKNFVADSNEMRNIFVLFCEDIGKICLAIDVFDGDRAIGNRFANGIFTNLQIRYIFGIFVATPLDCSHVVVKDCGCLMKET